MSNQFRILAKLYPDEADSHREAQEILESGYERHYPWISQHIYDDNQTMSSEECSEVIEILEMFDWLKQFELKHDLGSEVEPWMVHFSGFDGNDESKYMAYASFFCNQGDGRFKDIDRGDNFDSHCPSLDRYRRQLAAWRQAADRHNLSYADVKRIAQEAVHPEQRRLG